MNMQSSNLVPIKVLIASHSEEKVILILESNCMQAIET